MQNSNISSKLVAIVLLGGLFFVLSLLVLGAVVEREERHFSAQEEVASTWGKEQTIIGPVLTSEKTNADGEVDKLYVLPSAINFETVLEPEIRSRGIFDTVVYVSRVKVSGQFSASDLAKITNSGRRTAKFAMSITDTRGIEKQINLSWNKTQHPFISGAALPVRGAHGLYATVPIGFGAAPFSFEVQLKGTESILFAPIGQETSLGINSSWPTPMFKGSFLPSTREISADGFGAEWNVSSFGRAYPQSWTSDNSYFNEVSESVMGVELHEQVDFYSQVNRSVKYAILFIVITFSAFFLFEVLSRLRIHPIQYAFIGSALALFYLLLLSLAERIGFGWAYAIATIMIVALIGGYSMKVLQKKARGLSIIALLLVLYGYLYLVLQLEDLALLSGSLALFVLLAVAMYITRNVNWFNVSSDSK